MAYEQYVTSTDYTWMGYSMIEEDLDRKLREASRKIDALTYNRIVGQGFSNLTEFQQDIVKECVCEVADFYQEFDGLLDNVYTSYGINGVSMSLSSNGVVKMAGVTLRRGTYQKLISTGLCRRCVR